MANEIRLRLSAYKAHIANGIWVLLLQALQNVLSFVLVIVMVRVFSKDEVGQYQLIIASIGVAGMFALPGLQTAMVQSVARGFEGTFRSGLHVAFASSFLGSALLIAIGLYQAGEGKELIWWGCLVAAATFPFSYGLQGWTSYHAGHGLFRLNSIYQGLGAVLAFGSAVAMLLTLEVSIVVVVLITNLVAGIQNLVIALSIRRRVPPSAMPEPGAISYGLRTSVHGVFNIVATHADKFLIFYFLSSGALAVYAVAEKVPELLKRYMQSLRVVLIPDLSRRESYGRELDRKLTYAGIAISCGVIFIALAIVPWLIPIAFTEAYSDAVLYCQLLLGTLVVGQAATVKFTFILSKLDSRSYRDITIGANVVRLVASMVLVPLFGIFGAIASTAIYRIANAVLVWLCLRKFHSEPKPGLVA